MELPHIPFLSIWAYDLRLTAQRGSSLSIVLSGCNLLIIVLIICNYVIKLISQCWLINDELIAIQIRFELQIFLR